VTDQPGGVPSRGGWRGLKLGSFLAAVFVTALTAVVTLPFVVALAGAGNLVAALIALMPLLLVALVAFGRSVRRDDDGPGS
jgi:hypothetical protein